uniref:Uncharacterized protein n=1 Tax=Emiliania huxleyi TaxID=2903 RepID=Q4G376_EMIHU|nr:hypothetical protein EmhuCp083 [Emiliania huxleyi]AAX13890.1 unknown [Emiliania huxleyi]
MWISLIRTKSFEVCYLNNFNGSIGRRSSTSIFNKGAINIIYKLYL